MKTPMNPIFAICYRRGPNWVEGKKISEQPLQKHLAYMNALRASGSLLLGGPFVDDQGGLVIVSALDTDEAVRLAADDPAIHTGVMLADVHPWKVLAGEAALTGQAAAA